MPYTILTLPELFPHADSVLHTLEMRMKIAVALFKLSCPSYERK